MSHRAYDGGAGEVAQVIDAMSRLKTLAGPRGFLLVGDSKLVSYGNVTAMIDGAVTFIAPLAAARVPAGLFAGLDLSAATVVDYIAERDDDLPFWERCRYRVTEDVMSVSGPRKKDRAHALRRILVPYRPPGSRRQSPPSATRCRPHGSGHSGTHRRHPLPPRPAGRDRESRRDHPPPPDHRLPADDHHTGPDGKPAFAWSFDQAAIDAQAATDGWYALLTALLHNYLVRVREGEDLIEIRVHASAAVVARVAVVDTDENRIIEATAAYLIARQRADDLSAMLDLDDVAAAYDGFVEDICTQLDSS